MDYEIYKLFRYLIHINGNNLFRSPDARAFEWPFFFFFVIYIYIYLSLIPLFFSHLLHVGNSFSCTALYYIVHVIGVNMLTKNFFTWYLLLLDFFLQTVLSYRGLFISFWFKEMLVVVEVRYREKWKIIWYLVHFLDTLPSIAH